MIELLLITDIPRLRQIFTRLTEHEGIRLRVSASLESAANEIAAEKPSIIYVQTHLSGFSAEILLRHLKKQLGKKRTRFILLGAKNQVSEEALNQYQGFIDTSAEDDQLFAAALESVNLTRHIRSEEEPQSLPNEFKPDFTVAPKQEPLSPALPTVAETALTNTAAAVLPSAQENRSLEEQGITYSPRTPLSVYSEFTSSFDSAVSSMPSKDPEPESKHWSELSSESIEIEPTKEKPRWVSLLIWAIPLMVIAVAITMIQQHLDKPKPLDIAPTPAINTTEVLPAAKPANPAPVVDKPAAPANAAPAAATIPVSSRLTKLPDFIPQTNRDKDFSRTNPGWERYRGKKTDYKVFKEDSSIKAIQVINRDNKGISEEFMTDLLRQMLANHKFSLESSEKKDGYEIQRGRLAEGVSVVFYRDADNSRLRAFVVTWK